MSCEGGPGWGPGGLSIGRCQRSSARILRMHPRSHFDNSNCPLLEPFLNFLASTPVVSGAQACGAGMESCYKLITLGLCCGGLPDTSVALRYGVDSQPPSACAHSCMPGLHAGPTWLSLLPLHVTGCRSAATQDKTAHQQDAKELPARPWVTSLPEARTVKVHFVTGYTHGTTPLSTIW